MIIDSVGSCLTPQQVLDITVVAARFSSEEMSVIISTVFFSALFVFLAGFAFSSVLRHISLGGWVVDKFSFMLRKCWNR